jgi:hypothetical protein
MRKETQRSQHQHNAHCNLILSAAEIDDDRPLPDFVYQLLHAIHRDTAARKYE